MNEEVFLSFSTLIASVLLYKERVSSIELVNFISLLSRDNIYIEDEIDEGIEDLMICVECPNFDFFALKSNLTYDTCLFENVTVRDYLFSKASSSILEVIKKNNYFNDKISFNRCKIKSNNSKYK